MFINYQSNTNTRVERFSHKLYCNNVPTPIHKGMEKIGNTSSGLKAHSYGTRLKLLPNVLHHSFDRSLLCKAIMSFTKLPPDIQNLKSKKSFMCHATNH